MKISKWESIGLISFIIVLIASVIMSNYHSTKIIRGNTSSKGFSNNYIKAAYPHLIPEEENLGSIIRILSKNNKRGIGNLSIIQNQFAESETTQLDSKKRSFDMMVSCMTN